MPSDQEWALLMRMGAAVLWAFCVTDLRSGLINLFRAFLDKRILIALLLMISWISAEVALGHRVGLWTMRDASDTALWFFTSAAVIFVNLTSTTTSAHFFRHAIRRLFTVSTALVGFVYFFAVPLWIAIPLVPIEVLLIGVSVVAARSKELNQSKKLSDGLLWIIGVGLFLHATVRLLLGWGTLDKVGLVRSLALPIW